MLLICGMCHTYVPCCSNTFVCTAVSPASESKGELLLGMHSFSPSFFHLPSPSLSLSLSSPLPSSLSFSVSVCLSLCLSVSLMSPKWASMSHERTKRSLQDLTQWAVCSIKELHKRCFIIWKVKKKKKKIQSKNWTLRIMLEDTLLRKGGQRTMF